MAYAETTRVPVEKTVQDIASLARKAGADRIGQEQGQDELLVWFFMRERLVRFRVALPGTPQGDRQRARALLLVIKAKLESVTSQVETFEEAFLSNVVMSDNRTVYQRIAEPIALEYDEGKVTALLLTGPRT